MTQSCFPAELDLQMSGSTKVRAFLRHAINYHIDSISTQLRIMPRILRNTYDTHIGIQLGIIELVLRRGGMYTMRLYGVSTARIAADKLFSVPFQLIGMYVLVLWTVKGFHDGSLL